MNEYRKPKAVVIYDCEGVPIKAPKEQILTTGDLSGKAKAIGIVVGIATEVGLVFALFRILLTFNSSPDGTQYGVGWPIGFGLPYVVFPLLSYFVGRKVAERVELAMQPGNAATAWGDLALIVVTVVGVVAVLAFIVMALAIYAAVVAFVIALVLFIGLIAL